MLHGISVGALGFLLSLVLLGNLVAGTASSVMGGVSNMVGGLASGAGKAAQGVASQVGGIDPQALIDRARAALQGGGNPAQMTEDQRTAEIGRLLGQRVAQGPLPEGDRTRLTQLVSAQYGIPQPEAEQRLREAETQTQQALQSAAQRAREAGEAAATASAVAAYWFFAAMILGAVAAVLGARYGTRATSGSLSRRYA
jgi:hypothetical protein